MQVGDKAEVDANTSIGMIRPFRRAAVEATKNIEAAKAGVKDNAKKFRKGKGKAKAEDSSDDDEEESEDEEEEKVVKPKQKQKQDKGKKVKEEILSDGSDFEQEQVKPKVDGKKKQILAKAAYWKDIPKWEKGSKSLLMDLPGDIMDNIFGLREELGVSSLVLCRGQNDKLMIARRVRCSCWSQQGISTSSRR